MRSEIYISSFTAILMRVVAALITGLCLYLKFATGGWLMLTPMLGLYIVFSLLHFRFHSQALPHFQRTLHSFLLVAISHILFVSAFLLQYDFGDDRGWLTITALMHDGPGSESSQPPRWWPLFEVSNDGGLLIGILLNICVFVPAFITWGLMRKRQFDKRRG